MANSDNGMLAASHAGFQNRVKYFMQKGAVAVLGEDTTGFVAGRHDARKTYADKVLAGEASVFEMAVAVATNSTIVANITSAGDHSSVTDGDLEFTVNSMWDDFSGFEG